jgi:hypothetical protein
MSYFNSNGLQVISVFPAKYSKDVPVDSEIRVTFSFDLLTTSNEELVSAIKVRDNDTGAVVEGNYSYHARSIIIKPFTPLETNKSYSIVVFAGSLTDVTGGTLKLDYMSTFTTVKLAAPKAPEIVHPADSSSTVNMPTIKWTDVGSQYALQLATDMEFSNIVEDVQSIVETNWTPMALQENTQYYCRVRSIENDVRSEWSKISTFYYGLPTSNIPLEEQLLIEDYNPYRIVSVMPNPNDCMVPVTYKTATVVFSEDIDPTDVNNYVIVSCQPVNEENPYSKEIVVDVSCQVNGNTLLITMANDLKKNAVYNIKILKQLKSASGRNLVDDIEWDFITTLVPHYTTVPIIRMDIGYLIEDVPDDEIHRIIYDVSKYADFIADSPIEESNQQYFWCYTRYETENRLVNKQLMRIAMSQGETQTLADFTIKKDTSFVPDMNMALKDINAKLKKCEQKLSTTFRLANPRAVTKAGDTSYPHSNRRF